jgi:hypothetical protein
MMSLPFLYSLMWYFVKRAMQSSSQSWPMDMREPDFRSSKMCPTLACWDSSGAKGTMALFVVSIFCPLATWTDGPFVV